MSQFNKYLEIVQEGKDYQYNEGLLSMFSKKTNTQETNTQETNTQETNTKKIFNKILKENNSQPGLFLIDPKSTQKKEIEEEIKEIQKKYGFIDETRRIAIGETRAIVIGFLTIEGIIYKYENRRYYMDFNKNKSQEILQLIEKNKEYINHIIKIDGTGRNITYDLITYKKSYEAEQAKKKKEQEDYDHVPR
jgi:hypothetical protein